MVDPYLVRQLKRVHDQAAQTLDKGDPISSKAIAERFNELLEEFREEYPDEERLEKIDSVQGRKGKMRQRSIAAANEDLRKIKLQCTKIADIFNLDVDDFEKVDDSNEIRPIVINANTDVSQEVSQETRVSQTIEYTQLINQVDNAMISDEDEQELKKLIREFKNEMENDETDEARLRDLVSSAKKIGSGVGVQIGAKLTMWGLKGGYNLIP